MSTGLYPGNFRTDTTDTELQTLFATVGMVKLVILPVVTLNGHQVHQSAISVAEIDPPEERRILHSHDGGFRQQKYGGWWRSGERK